MFTCAVLGTQRFNAFDKSFPSNLKIIMSKKETYFRNEWLLDAEFKEWIEEVKGDRTKLKCKLCRREFNLSNMGTAALKSHMKYQKHIELVKIKKNSSIFFKKGKF